MNETGQRVSIRRLAMTQGKVKGPCVAARHGKPGKVMKAGEIVKVTKADRLVVEIEIVGEKATLPTQCVELL